MLPCCRCAAPRAARLERGDELAPRGGGRIGCARAADEDDAGGKGIGAIPTHTVVALRPHRPGAADGEAGTDHRIKEGLPAGAGGAHPRRRSPTV